MDAYKTEVQAAVDTNIFDLIEGSEPGRWYEATRDLPKLLETAIMVCGQARLIEVQDAGGRLRFKLTAAGEAVQFSRPAIIEAVQKAFAADDPADPAQPDDAAVVDGLDAESRALAVLAKHPGLTSVARIAKLAQCSRQYLEKPGACPKFKAALGVARESNVGNVRKGTKGKDGTIEAWEKKSG